MAGWAEGGWAVEELEERRHSKVAKNLKTGLHITWGTNAYIEWRWSPVPVLGHAATSRPTGTYWSSANSRQILERGWPWT